MEMTSLTRDGTAEPASRDQILRREREQGNGYFPCSAADHEQDWQPYPVDPYSCYDMCDHTYMCVCFLPIDSGRQVRWMYQQGSHRRKVAQNFSSTFLLRCIPLFFSREGFSRSFPSSTVKSNFVFWAFFFFLFIIYM